MESVSINIINIIHIIEIILHTALHYISARLEKQYLMEVGGVPHTAATVLYGMINPSQSGPSLYRFLDDE
jgi:hypothetical protein